MSDSERRVALVAFAPSSECRTVEIALGRLGYEITQLDPSRWLGAGEGRGDTLTLLLLSHERCPINGIVRQCTRQQVGTVLPVLARPLSRWDHRILSMCRDFVTWPCEPDEIAFRLRRTAALDDGYTAPPNEAALLEEFVHHNMLGRSPAFLTALRLLKRFALSEAPVLIEGETGTGKEMAARALHYMSRRRDEPFVPFNAGALPDELVSNELFGHERGAFTDAKEAQPGVLAQADGGTLFLDEVDALSRKAQVALLRFLEDRRYRPLGACEARQVDLRIVAASNTRLEDLADQKQFRRDLLFRLKVLALELPPLRKRPGDVELLAAHFVRQCCARYGGRPKTIHPRAMLWLAGRAWRGNVRELENLIHRAFVLSDGDLVQVPESIAEPAPNADPTSRAAGVTTTYSDAKSAVLSEFEKRYFTSLIAQTEGNISEAARRAAMQRGALRRLLQKHGLADRPARRSTDRGMGRRAPTLGRT